MRTDWSRLQSRDFTHVSGATDYMRTVVEIIDGLGAELDVLDMPAGDGFVVTALRERGHRTVGADINAAHPEFVFADMEARLPFDDDTFDAVSCLEGIEHVLDENHLVRELFRITRPGGHVVISTPNVMNLYSRWHTFWRGYPYQFAPGGARHARPGRPTDRGHVTPVSYLRLRYLFEAYGGELVQVAGDRTKKAILLPLMLPVALIGRAMSRGDFRFGDHDDTRQRAIDADLASRPVRRSRSLITVARVGGGSTTRATDA